MVSGAAKPADVIAGASALSKTATAADPIAAAQARLLHDSSIQFRFDAAPPPPQAPPWLVALLKAIGQALHGLAEPLGYLLWALLIGGVLSILVYLGRDLLAPPKLSAAKTLGALDKEAAWRPDRAVARALLEDADRLAAAGQFTDAAHVLLFRSIEDVRSRAPHLIAPSLTSRDIACLPEIPAAPRSAFNTISDVVEQAVFGRRPVDAPGWIACRDAYAAFAFPDGWEGAA
jgi:hypothetical protein